MLSLHSAAQPLMFCGATVVALSQCKIMSEASGSQCACMTFEVVQAVQDSLAVPSLVTRADAPLFGNSPPSIALKRPKTA